MKRVLPWLVLVAAGVFVCVGVYAASLTYVSDLISTSGPGFDATHTIEFRATHAIPPSGHIRISLEAGAFSVPGGFDVSDVDVSVASSGPFLDRSLASTASASEDGVVVITGATSSIVITLNSNFGIGEGETVRVVLGTDATFEATGDTDIQNPLLVGSYRIFIETTDQVNTRLDAATAMIAVVDQVAAGTIAPVVAPNRFNGLPSGEIAAGNSTIEISLETVEFATCRYATSSGVVYGSMTGSFSPSLGKLFYTVITGHQDATTYNYYVRCVNQLGSPNDDDYLISFTLKATPSVHVSVPGSGPTSTTPIDLGPGGQGSYPGGSSLLYLASVTISGWTTPYANVTILKDGVSGVTTRAAQDGSFHGEITGLERGTYTFQIYSEDGKRRKTSIHSITISLGSGTDNTVTNVVLSPSMEVVDDSIGIGDKVDLKGEAVPSSAIEISLLQQTGGATSTDAKLFRASSTGNGVWEMSLDGKFQKGMYYVKARSLQKNGADSDFSNQLSFGVGQGGASDLSLRADINKDGKVNLVDFSILLSNWGGDGADSDINQDGAINLADFSIQLFHWTG